ncbi:MAG: hypothetical protein QM300_09080 [Pseudomonadota bacterium]|nr:hypothetical protein [Pseudomonadota bacterium]
MKIKKVFNIILSIVFIYAALVFASEFKVYPGAKIDEKTTKEANEAAQAPKCPTSNPRSIQPRILSPKLLRSTKACQKNI